jgi:hypothetical protein
MEGYAAARVREGRSIIVGAVLAVTLTCLAGPAAAAPPFGPPVDVAPGDQQAVEPSATYDGAALLEIGWTTASGETSTLATARRPLGGSFAPGPAIDSGPDVRTGPALATGPDGTIYAAWSEPNGELGRVWAAALNASGAPVSPVAVSDADDDASEPSIAVGADGRPAIAWTVTVDEE